MKNHPNLHPPVTVLFLLAAVFSFGAGCASSSLIAGMDASRPGRVLAERVVLPTEQCGQFFIAETYLNHRGPYSMIVDSGASVTTITPRVARECRARRRARHFRMGEFVRERIPVYVTELQHIADAVGLPVDGIVGHDVFRDVLVTYDYRNGRMLVSNDRLDVNHEDTIRTLKNRRPYVTAETSDGKTMRLLIDTGSSRGVSIRDMSELTFHTALKPIGASMHIDGLRLAKGARLDGDVRVGPVVVREPIVDDSLTSNILGQQVLRNFVVSFDQRSRLVRFQPVRDNIVNTESRRGIGAAWTAEDGVYHVVAVYESSAGQHNGLREGDVVLAINGTAVADYGCRMNPSWVEASAVELQVQRAGETFELHVPVVVLVD